MTVATIFCTRENVTQFRDAMKTAAPDAYEFAVALHKAGMVDGLRNAQLRPLSSPPTANAAAVVPQTSYDAEKRIADLWWQRGQGAR